MNTVDPRSLRDTEIKINVFSSQGGLGIHFWDRRDFVRVLSGINLWIREPPVLAAAAAPAAVAVQAAGPLAAWGERQLWVQARVLPSIREAAFSYPLAIFTHSVRMPQKKGPKGLWEEEACFWSSMHGRPAGLFTAAPLVFAYASASSLSCLSLCSFTWPLCWAALQQGNGASRTGPGVSNRHTGRPFLEVPSKPLKIIDFWLRIQFGEVFSFLFLAE